MVKPENICCTNLFLSRLMLFLLQEEGYVLSKLAVKAGYARTYFHAVKERKCRTTAIGAKSIRAIFNEYSCEKNKRIVTEFAKHSRLHRTFAVECFRGLEFLRYYRDISTIVSASYNGSELSELSSSRENDAHEQDYVADAKKKAMRKKEKKEIQRPIND